jgi:predicted nuclease of predicted toxin-antitoxin system
VRLLLDEMWPPALARQLRDRGHDVIAVAERPDLGGMPDSAIFEAALREERAIVTENVVDFRPLAAAAVSAGRAHPALILTSNRRFPRHDPRTLGRILAALDELLASHPELSDSEYWLWSQPLTTPGNLLQIPVATSERERSHGAIVATALKGAAEDAGVDAFGVVGRDGHGGPPTAGVRPPCDAATRRVLERSRRSPVSGERALAPRVGISTLTLATCS